MLYKTLMKLTAADLVDLQRLTESWETYPVIWQSDGVAPSLGNGTLYGRKLVSGKTRCNIIKMVAGSTTTFGTGIYQWSLSDTPRDQYYTGSMYIQDAGTAHLAAISIVTNVGTLQGITVAAGPVTATAPMTWAVNDIMTTVVWYEVA